MSKFEILWRAMRGPALLPEYRFHPTRKWRLDWFHESGVCVEIEGGIWIKGRHTRGKGFLADIEKYNALAERGILLFRVPANEITIQRLAPIYDTIQRGGSLTYQKLNKEEPQ
ncbi:MAG: hypothetical protein EBR82_52820 [Caulobacteraceae bacterium]|nr:hypothetical protein [Caulobacteraceae bacterium]